MNQFLLFIPVVIFSIFLGSQITEGVLFIPYWKSLSTAEFYKHYFEIGNSIGTFYSILTILAVLTPIILSVFCYYINSPALIFSIVSTFFALLLIVIFYLYFKSANQQFYAATLNSKELKSLLINWEIWHWIRVLFEIISLIFLVKTLSVINKTNKQ